VPELAVQQRFLTEDEISDARAMIGWQFWAAPVVFGFASLGLGIGAFGGNPVIIFVFLLVFSAAVILFLSRVRDFMGQSFAAVLWPLGAKNAGFDWNSFSQANRCRTPTWKASTDGCGMSA
jgi:hypothetical protein